MRRLRPFLLLLLLVSGCGYFNSLYNARREFAAAEGASRRGEAGAARTAYGAAVEKAAVSYRRYPTGRWADDALLLIGRARFAMGEYEAARAALLRVTEQTADAELRSTARAYLGAALVRLDQPDSALASLDAAYAGVDRGSELQRFVQLWRGRARLARGQPAGWEDLAAVAGASSPLAVEAGLETAARGLELGDSARTAGALAVLTGLETAAPRSDSIARLLTAAGARWSPGFLRAALPEDAGARWPGEARTRVRLEGARLSAAAGDTATAIRLGRRAAEQSSGPAAADARHTVARWLLALAEEPEDLTEVRAVLLPAFASARPLALMRQVRTLEELLTIARDGQAAALFAGGEYARDVLGAPRLAGQLFVAFADVAPENPSAPKALLAALQLSAGGSEREALQARIQATPANPYVRALSGTTDGTAYALAEERLGRAIAAVRADAEAAAAGGDLRVDRAIAVLDSVRAAARSDSIRVGCGALLDSLAVSGIRADSVRSACLRADSALMRRFLEVDSAMLRDTVRADSTRPDLPQPDTMTDETR